MPLFKADGKLIFYAHVPKCAGSSVQWYLHERFGDLAFSDSTHTAQPPARRWSRTSPQHIDRASLSRLFPDGFFDAMFTIVRHPVARLVSAYHFQRDVEKLVPATLEFSDWLADVEERLIEDPFSFDNHVRPMTEMVPEGAEVFHVEHGLDCLVDWFDALTGRQAGPRALLRVNEQGAHGGGSMAKAEPSATDLTCIARVYAADFDRFGYVLQDKAPLRPAPVMTPERLAERAAAQAALNSPAARLRRKLARLRG